MRRLRRLFTLMILGGQLLLLYWRIRGRLAPYLPYVGTALEARPQIQQFIKELRQINDNLKRN